jgi:hypothetical protein
MNTTNTQQKKEWLKAIGYTVQELENGSVTATYEDNQISLSDTELEISCPLCHCRMTGWKALGIVAFVNIISALNMVPPIPNELS